VLKQHRARFDECPKVSDQRKQVKLQLLQNLSQTNGNNMKNVRYETSRLFRKKSKYLKEKINELLTKVKVMCGCMVPRILNLSTRWR
jgi:hypothetical protein